MSLTQIIIFSLLGATIIIISIVLIKSLIAPQKIEGIKKYLKQGKLTQAENIAKKIIQKNPRDYVAHYLLGKTYMADNKAELAFMEYKLVDQNAIFNGAINEVTFRKEMATLYTKFNQEKEALRELLILSKYDSTNADYDYQIGKIYESQGRGDLALGFYQKAVSKNRRHPKAHAALGYMLFRLKQNLEAKKEIDLAIQLSPQTYSNYYYLGKILKDNQDYPSAIRAFEKAERDPEFRQKTLIERGSCYMAGNSIDNAIVEFQKAISAGKEEQNETKYAHYFLATCYEKSRLLDKAIEQWEAIYKVDKKFRDVNQKLSQYKELQANDSMKEYLTCSSEKFLELCKQAALKGMELFTIQIKTTKNGCSLLARDARNDNWMANRQQQYRVDFYRVTDPIDDTAVRSLADEVKKMNYAKGFICASAGFTRTAENYAETRPVELINKDKLEKVLAKAGIE